MIGILPTIGQTDIMTEADWGRFYSYNSVGDFGLVMPYRSYYFRNFIPGHWTDLKIGFIHRARGAASDTANVTEERPPEYTISNLFHFGLSNSDYDITPGNNPYFMGLRGVVDGITRITEFPLQLADTKLTLVNNAPEVVASPIFEIPLSHGVSANPFSFVGIRFVFNSSNNRIYLKVRTETNISSASLPGGNNTTAIQLNFEALKTRLNAIEMTSFADADASFAIGSLANFRTFYIYWPFVLNRLCLHCVGVIKNA